MMKKNKKRWTQIKLLLFVPVLLLLLIACARPEKILNLQEAPSSFISVTLEKDRNIIFQNRNYDYEKFEDFLKENYRWYKRKLDLSAEVKWDTAVGYQGIHKLAKILDKRGFENTDFKPFGADGKFLPPPSQQNQSHNDNKLDIKPENSKTPVLRIYEDRLLVDFKYVLTGELYSHLKNIFSEEGIPEKIVLYVHGKNIDESFIDRVYSELKKFQDLKIKRNNTTAPPPPPPIFAVKLYEDRIIVLGQGIPNADEMATISEIIDKANSFLEKTGDNYYATIYAGDNIPQNQIDSILNELKKIGMTKVKFKKMN